MIYLLAFLGLAVSFLIKYGNRKNKKNFDPKYWIKDNWPETLASILMVAMLLIIFSKSTFDYTPLTQKLPLLKSLPMDWVMAGVAGYLNTELFYLLFKHKRNYSVKKALE